jgi:hypothetical protein
MNVVSGDRVQLSPNVASQYITEACGDRSFVGNNPLPCQKTDNITDQFISDIRCGAFSLDIKRCAKPDQFQCEIGLSSKNEIPLISVSWLKNAPFIRCSYDAAKIDTLAQLQNFKLIFGETDDYKKLATQYCSTNLSSKCPNTGTKCSKFRSIDEDGTFCRTFYNAQSVQSQESIGQNVCFVSPNIPECACYTRATNPAYRKLSISAPFKDSCWYIPCRDSFSNLIPADLRNPSCPNNVCQFILDTANNNNVNISEIKSTIDCQFEPSPQPPKPLPPAPATKPISLFPFIVVGASVSLVTGLYAYNRRQQNI